MSSRFVSGGTTDAETGEIVPADPSTSTSTSAAPAAGGSSSAKRSEEWAAVQAQVEEERRRRQQLREEAASRGGGEGEKSLYDVLQANKAAKQAAFEEANKIKNQFRPLDDDEVEFLDGVRERKRAEEERLRQETEEGLKGFRELQSKISSGEAAPGDEDAVAGGGWSVGRKRKRRKDEPEGLIKGLKRRSSGAAVETTDTAASTPPAAAKDARETQEPATKPAAAAATKPKVGLVDYGSDDSD
ncbi:hypothetical protein KVR01_003768 [Diaporthe batatas]|uniref:uncharacterized protein n=1 Tax=Diaporthe batatas TaxID=748121 RepID=UPI001D053610|nr:uncharacterized protein KVR01_003768 [Diaporthe batatas]KAG8168079.1 hypothetical protein KVR01_003768 [Diaporthe batatas]